MTAKELTEILETKSFVLQKPFEPIKFRFEKGIIYKDDKPTCKYNLGELPNGHYQMTYSNLLELDKGRVTYTFVFGYENILVVIEDDNRFPNIINFNPSRMNGTFTVLKAE